MVLILSTRAMAMGPDISGYFDIAFLSPKDKSSYYHQQHFNLLMHHQVNKFSFFAELEFEDTPNIDYGRIPGAPGGGVDGGKGRLFLERAYGEMRVNSYFTIRMGQLLTPTYYYLNHYPSIVVNYTNPLTMKTIFNYNEMGVQVLGGNNGLHYDLWTGKGPSSSDAAQNESGVNLGGKISYTTKYKSGEFTLSGLAASYSLGDNPALPTNAKKAEWATGAEFIMSYDQFSLFSEYGVRDLKDAKGLNGNISGTNKVTAYYVLGSYSIGLESYGELIPWIMVDGLKYKEGFDSVVDTTAINRTSLGLTYRPIPIVNWKLEYENGGAYRPKYANGSLYHIADSNYVEDKVALEFVYFYN